MPKVHAIVIYPIKAFDGVPVVSNEITNGGALKYDRSFALRTKAGVLVNGKKFNRVHRVRTAYDLENLTAKFHLTETQKEYTFHLKDDAMLIGEVFSEYFSVTMSLVENIDSGFPDDGEAWGPTIVSLASLREVNTWFPELSLPELIRRFRPNIIVDDVPAFWEDNLFGAEETETEFTIGDVQCRGVNPCQRCVVPTRDTLAGTVTDTFQKTFATNRERTLPEWSERSRFNHYYRFCVNTRIANSEAHKFINVGDAIRLDDEGK